MHSIGQQIWNTQQPLRGLEGVPGLPGAPQDEAGLTTRGFHTQLDEGPETP